MLSTALELANQGYYIFPLVPGGKTPAIRGWQSRSTRDPVTINTWWQGEFQDSNIGIATHPSGLVVVDLDDKDGKCGSENYKAIMHWGDDNTLTVRTPSGGLHYYYLDPTVGDTVFNGNAGVGDYDLRSSVSLVGEGIDTRATGGYVVAPGSITDKGAYEWVTADTHQKKMCPEWLSDKLRRPRVTRTQEEYEGIEYDNEVAVNEAVQYLKTAPRAIQGQGGDAITYQVACQLHDLAISQERAVALMMEHWNDRNLPEWSVEALKTKMSNAYAFAQNPPGIKSIAFGAIKSAPKSIKRASDIHIANLPERDWLLEGRLIAGYVSLTIAPGGVGKSMYTMLEAISVATGRPLTGVKPARSGAVLIYNTEDPVDEIERRVLAIAEHYEIPRSELENVYYSSGVESPLRFVVQANGANVVTEDGEKLREIIEDNEIVLTVIDPFVRSHGVEENSNAAIDMVIQQLSALAYKTSSSVSVVHHTKKNGGKGYSGDMDSARGASSLSSASRIVTTISALDEDSESPQTSAVIKVQLAKGNMVEGGTKYRTFEKKTVTLGNGDKVGVLEKVGTTKPRTSSRPVEFSSIDRSNEIYRLPALIAGWFGLGESTPLSDIIRDMPIYAPDTLTDMNASQKRSFLLDHGHLLSNEYYKVVINVNEVNVKENQ